MVLLTQQVYIPRKQNQRSISDPEVGDMPGSPSTREMETRLFWNLYHQPGLHKEILSDKEETREGARQREERRRRMKSRRRREGEKVRESQREEEKGDKKTQKTLNFIFKA